MGEFSQERQKTPRRFPLTPQALLAADREQRLRNRILGCGTGDARSRRGHRGADRKNGEQNERAPPPQVAPPARGIPAHVRAPTAAVQSVVLPIPALPSTKYPPDSRRARSGNASDCNELGSRQKQIVHRCHSGSIEYHFFETQHLGRALSPGHSLARPPLAQMRETASRGAARRIGGYSGLKRLDALLWTRRGDEMDAVGSPVCEFGDVSIGILRGFNSRRLHHACKSLPFPRDRTCRPEKGVTNSNSRQPHGCTSRSGVVQGRRPVDRLRFARVSQFFTSASAYDRFMGRFSVQLGPPFADFVGVEAVGRALDVGCGPGGLTAELARRLGAENVSAIDPSEAFVEAARARNPEVDVRHAPAEEIPFADDTFDFALAQLVVHFMTDAVAGLREMARVTRQSGAVGACVWDYYGGMSPLSPFWSALEEFDPAAENESQLAGARARGSSATCFGRRGSKTCRSLRSPSASSSRASRSGGRHTSSASVRRERTSRSSPGRGATSSANSAARACLRRRSRSQARPGRRAASPRDHGPADATVGLAQSDGIVPRARRCRARD